MPRILCLLSLVGLLTFAAGCAKKNVTVKGTILNDGKPIEVSKTGYVQITLVPDVPPGQPFTSKVGRPDSQGNFEIADVPLGKYKVAIEHMDPTPAADKLGGKFSPQNTKIVRDIDGKNPVTVDISKPTG